MMRSEAIEALRAIFAAVLDLPVSAVTGELSPDNCEKWDSLHHIHLVSAIEEEFDLKLGVEAEVEILSFDLAVLVVCEALSAAGRPVG
jgi:acyl carrier protein